MVKIATKVLQRNLTINKKNNEIIIYKIITEKSLITCLSLFHTLNLNIEVNEMHTLNWTCVNYKTKLRHQTWLGLDLNFLSDREQTEKLDKFLDESLLARNWNCFCNESSNKSRASEQTIRTTHCKNSRVNADNSRTRQFRRRLITPPRRKLLSIWERLSMVNEIKKKTDSRLIARWILSSAISR